MTAFTAMDDPNCTHRSHFECAQCRRMFCARCGSELAMATEVWKTLHYQCDDCQAKEAKEAADEIERQAADPADPDGSFEGPWPTPSRTKTIEDNPALSCTVEQLAFAAWQRAVGATSLVESGPAWDLFATWWKKHATEYSTIRDVCAMAWAESSARALEAWWHGVVASAPRRR